MKILARHKWVAGATITESMKESDDLYRKFTATIRGFRNWKIAEGYIDGSNIEKLVVKKVKDIRDRIDGGDESVFDKADGIRYRINKYWGIG